ncbi:RpiB/LacA/LacB family sugar-phosphate isomerase [Candidatus Woesebacteria bacterium]|nr:RpiB/LacA/LacB family sugar-phosphate isomerase [Candidatus Woesebacteria bacterium]MCD8506983.1 RpiB/LacA/LacB family sugar-phosphate isomerase [Candidatus Woesebacteria bacterium]MCD8527274.1 RpiB/LacA/LacB family sugar-phosphate isomerase [Candidatus Woesebacteria bacterium]MCD8546640.1 RpiB/LacA/LacB family sugar-phosphate isomerase [Candidatus Woesebacteria bacterium]
MQVFLGADHGGFAIKEALRLWLKSHATELTVSSVTDCGAHELDPSDDYPQFGAAVAREISTAVENQSESEVANPTTIGILVCRTGGGMAIMANRFPQVRAVVCRNEADVIHAREHNNANVLVLEGDHVKEAEAQHLVQVFLQTEFGAGRHSRRVAQLSSRNDF